MRFKTKPEIQKLSGNLSVSHSDLSGNLSVPSVHPSAHPAKTLSTHSAASPLPSGIACKPLCGGSKSMIFGSEAAEMRPILDPEVMDWDDEADRFVSQWSWARSLTATSAPRLDARAAPRGRRLDGRGRGLRLRIQRADWIAEHGSVDERLHQARGIFRRDTPAPHECPPARATASLFPSHRPIDV